MTNKPDKKETEAGKLESRMSDLLHEACVCSVLAEMIRNGRVVAAGEMDGEALYALAEREGGDGVQDR